MSNLALVLGESGTGKSTAIKTLNPKETIVINVLGKPLPFKGSARAYSKENKNMFQTTDWQQVGALLKSISDKVPSAKNVVVDDAVYILRTEFFNRSKENGFNRYNEMADHWRRIIAECGALRDGLNVFLMLHCEPVENDGNVVGYKASSVGKLIDKMYRPEESASVVLYAKPKYDDKGNPQFGFYTHRRMVDGVELPSKTPDGMFEDDFIPNGLQFIADKMNEYYNG